MRTLSMIIADGNVDFTQTVNQELQKSFITHLCHDGKEALEAAVNLRPDLLVLELMLTGLDGLTLLEKLHDAGLHPLVIAVTRQYNEYVLDCAAALGVAYVIRKPCEPLAVAKRVLDFSRLVNPGSSSPKDSSVFLAEMLYTMHFTSRHRGTDFIKVAVRMAAKEPGIPITKALYPTIAAQTGCSAFQIERSIRSAICAAWEHSDPACWAKFFPADGDGQVPRPSNGQFIIRLAEILREKFPPECI